MHKPEIAGVDTAPRAGSEYLVSGSGRAPTRHMAHRGRTWWSVPTKHRRAFAYALLWVLSAASVDRGLAGLGIAMAAGSAVFATGMIFGAETSRSPSARRPTLAAEEYSMARTTDAPTESIDEVRTGSIFKTDVDAHATRPQPARPPASARDDAGEPSGHGVSSYVLRYADVDVALLQGPGGTLVVVPGAMVPDAGQVRAIEKRAGRWVVVTATGTIEEPPM